MAGEITPDSRATSPGIRNRPMHRIDAYEMVRRRTAEAGLKGKLGCHVFRATGITAYLEARGTLENAQAMAAHESPRTTKLHDHTGGGRDPHCRALYGKATGSTKLGSLFFTLPTRGLTGHAIMPSEG
jgi:hypothetical protein